MSKLKSEKINFDDDSFVVEIEIKNPPKKTAISEIKEEPEDDIADKKEEIIESAQEEKEKILSEAQKEAREIIFGANSKAEEINSSAKKEAQDIIEEAKKEASLLIENAKKESDSASLEILENAKKEASKLIEESKDEIEKERTQAANQGYKEGYEDAGAKIKEELEEKIKNFDNFCSKTYEVKDKILKAASRDIFDIIQNISRKILTKEVDGNILDTIIRNTINLLDKKENITITLSEKYAKLLFELQNNALNEEIDYNFENFKNYLGFDVSYNPDLKDDTIIVENLTQRFDSSLESQLEVIIREIYKKSHNGSFEVEEYIKDETN